MIENVNEDHMQGKQKFDASYILCYTSNTAFYMSISSRLVGDVDQIQTANYRHIHLALSGRTRVSQYGHQFGRPQASQIVGLETGSASTNRPTAETNCPQLPTGQDLADSHVE